MRKAVFLDFDGVLFDTVKEAYYIAMLASGKAESADDIDFNSEHYAKFRKYRFLITKAPDYYYLLKAIDKRNGMPGIYSALLGTDKAGEEKFKRKYFARRKSFKTKNRDFWLSLNTPYVFFHRIRYIVGRKPEVFFIITTKDKDTVIDLLKIQGIRFFKRNIFDLSAGDVFRSKREAILFVCGKYRVKRSLYIDDSAYHLAQASGIPGMDILQAGWGYAGGSKNTAGESEALARIEKFFGGKNV
ncbi:MAG: hypothetical protein WC522_00320 [Candidatus Omnitrophota bacterium]